jgi:hypothetical protein
MRPRHALPIAVVVLAHAWAAGCSDLSSDCELNLTCVEGASSSGGGAPPDAGQAPDAGADAAAPADAGADASAACHGIFAPGECTTCLEASCCGEIAACTADAKCFACYTGQVAIDECHAASTEAALQQIIGCQGAKCTEACMPKDTCNPVTSAGCEAQAGSACDLGAVGTFQCFPPPNEVALCETCTPGAGKYCAPGMTCLFPVNRCARYCCTDADCGTGTCWHDATRIFGAPLALAEDDVGVCVVKAPGAAEDPKPACEVPADPPSDGACVGGYSPG